MVLRGTRLSEGSELRCRYAVLLHLDVQGLVVGSEEPRRLASLLFPLVTMFGPRNGLCRGTAETPT
jgi:hypothetical protein